MATALGIIHVSPALEYGLASGNGGLKPMRCCAVRVASMALVILIGVSACAPQGPSSSGARSGSVPEPIGTGAPKRITAAILADPPVLNTKINPGTVVTPGHEEVERLI